MTEHPLIIERRQLLAEFLEHESGDMVRLRRFALLREASTPEWRRVVSQVLTRKQRIDDLSLRMQIAWN